MSASVWLHTLLKRPWLAPGACTLALETALRRLASPRSTKFETHTDPELSLGPLRFNSVQGLLRRGDIPAAVAAMCDVIDQTLPTDTYSCAQRISNAFYVARVSGDALPAPIVARLTQDVTRVASFPEFRRNNSWFNNHLLNDFRALALYSLEWGTASDCQTTSAMDQIERILQRNLDTLFVAGQGPMLNEGSVSYEILVLARVFDIALAVPERPLGRLFGTWLTERATGQVGIYLREHDRAWLLPAVGDVTPDWTWADAIGFLDDVFLGRNTMYRRVWGSALEALGFPPTELGA